MLHAVSSFFLNNNFLENVLITKEFHHFSPPFSSSSISSILASILPTLPCQVDSFFFFDYYWCVHLCVCVWCMCLCVFVFLPHLCLIFSLWIKNDINFMARWWRSKKCLFRRSKARKSSIATLAEYLVLYYNSLWIYPSSLTVCLSELWEWWGLCINHYINVRNTEVTVHESESHFGLFWFLWWSTSVTKRSFFDGSNRNTYLWV